MNQMIADCICALGFERRDWFDDLLNEIFGAKATHRTHGERTPEGRAKLRSEIDAQVAYLYGLTESEFAQILGTFPLVAETVKAAALAAFRENAG